MDRDVFVDEIRNMLEAELTPKEIAAAAGMSFSRVMANARTRLGPELLDWRAAMICLVEGLRQEGLTMREALDYIGIYKQTYLSWRKGAGFFIESTPADEDDTVYSPPLDGHDDVLEQVLRSPWR